MKRFHFEASFAKTNVPPNCWKSKLLSDSLIFVPKLVLLLKVETPAVTCTSELIATPNPAGFCSTEVMSLPNAPTAPPTPIYLAFPLLISCEYKFIAFVEY